MSNSDEITKQHLLKINTDLARENAMLKRQVSNLIYEIERTRLDYSCLRGLGAPFTKGVSKCWLPFLTEEFQKPYSIKLFKVIKNEYITAKVFPHITEVLRAFRLCSYKSVKVVILGQDPYYNGRADGLAFSVSDGLSTPPSLRNILSEIEDDLCKEVITTDLSLWATQGVLLLNTVLTVREGLPQSHANLGWEVFTDNVIKKLSSEKEGLVFLLWGRSAQLKCKHVDINKHTVISCSHPSPLSVTKTTKPFKGSKCFSQTNDALKRMGNTEILW